VEWSMVTTNSTVPFHALVPTNYDGHFLYNNSRTVQVHRLTLPATGTDSELPANKYCHLPI
jgi:hypothetical protein